MKARTYNIPYLKFKTHAYVYGDLAKCKCPIILLHGGPGGVSYRYEALAQLADENMAIIFYDQLGCGYSKVPPKNERYWTFAVFLDELANLISYFHLSTCVLLGHSWGGMLALKYMIEKCDKRVKGLILYSTLPSTKLWNEEHQILLDNLKKNLKPRESLKKAFYEKYIKSKGEVYKYKRKKFPKRNDEIYRYMWGNDELFGTGTLKDYDVTNELGKIKVPTLIINGEFDESTDRQNRVLNEGIKGSVRYIVKDAHHGSYNEKTDEVIALLRDWYKNNILL